jgi:hypothetical protein
MANKALKPAGGTVIRVTQLDECGNPSGCYAVSECWSTAQKTQTYTDPQQFAPVNANGQVCFAVRQPPGLLWNVLDLALNAVDPVIWEILTGAPLVLDDSVPPVPVGWQQVRNQILNSRFAFEMWLRQAPDACEPGNVPYIYQLEPYVVQGMLADFSVGQEAINFGIQQALGIGPSPWGVGPYNVLKDNTGAPSPLLTPIPVGGTDGDGFTRTQLVTLAPPTPTLGCQPVEPTFVIAPAGGPAPLAVVATLPVDGNGDPILPGIITWAPAVTEVVTTGATVNHNYAAAGVFTPTYTPTAVSSPTYTGNTVTVT